MPPVTAPTDPREWTAAQLEQVFHAALEDGDTKGVEAALTLLSGKDPARAVRLYEDLTFALRVVEVLRL
jgi:hypothetical protein